MFNGITVKLNKFQITRTFYVWNDGSCSELFSDGWHKCVTPWANLYNLLKYNGYNEV